MASVPASVPPRIRELLRQCLQKDRQRRLRDIADARIEDRGRRNGSLRKRRVVGSASWCRCCAGPGTLRGRRPVSTLRSIPSGPHDRYRFFIADPRNGTDDPTFTRTLEPMLKALALEGADFISARRSGIARNLGVRPPETLDERAALEMALKQGLGVVLSISLDRQGTRLRTVGQSNRGGDRQGDCDRQRHRARQRGSGAGRRHEVGDRSSAKPWATRRRRGSTLRHANVFLTSLEVVRAYAAAAEARRRAGRRKRSNSRSRSRWINFGLGYAGMASALLEPGQTAGCRKCVKEAVRHLDSMTTERERYRTRGLFYMVSRRLSGVCQI